MRLTQILLCTALVGCGSDDTPKIDPDFQEAYNVYMTFAPNKGDADELESIQWTDEELDGIPERRGRCYVKWDQVKGKRIPGTTKRKILIRRQGTGEGAYWLKALVAHELGHCLHNFGHSADEDAIMWGAVALHSDEYWQEHLSERLYEMFHGKVYEP